VEIKKGYKMKLPKNKNLKGIVILENESKFQGYQNCKITLESKSYIVFVVDDETSYAIGKDNIVAIVE
jgi:hypothetical protein